MGTVKEVFVREKDSHFDISDLPVIQNLVALGYNSSEIGFVLGYQGSNWKLSAAKTLPEYKDAMEMGQRLADSFLISQLFKQSIGYNYEEVVEQFKAVPDFDKETGEPTTKLIKTGEEVRHKHQPGNGKLAEFLALNRLPDLFKKSLEVTRKSFDLSATAELSADQIERLAGRIMEVLGQHRLPQNGQEGPSKAIESTIIPEPLPEVIPGG